MRKLVVFAAVAAALSCGGGSGPAQKPAEGGGTVAGRLFLAQDAVFNTGSWKGFDFSGVTTAVQLSDFPGQCALDTSRKQPPGTQTLTLVLAENDASGIASPVSAPGEFPIAASSVDALAHGARRADAFYDLGGSGASGSLACFKAAFQGAAHGVGRVTVTAASADRVEGTFDVTLAGGDRLTGAFAAPRCGTTCVPGAACTGLDLNVSPTCP
jgi:hypothetical protein